MENATKAMLIAAAILITIVLISVGIILLGSSSSVSDDADEVGDAISIGAKDARRAMYKGKNIPGQQIKEVFPDMSYIRKEIPVSDFPDAALLNNVENYAENVLVIGYLLQGWNEGGTWTSLTGDTITPLDTNNYEDMINDWIPKQLKQKNLKKVFDWPDTVDLLKRVRENVNEKHNIELDIKEQTRVIIMFLNEEGKQSGDFENHKIAKLVYLVMLKR